VLRLRYSESPLDPHDAFLDGPIQMLVSTLVGLDEDMHTVPALAESWVFTDDQRHVTFHLREASYSNGEPIVAADFVYGWRRLLDPREGWDLSENLADVAGAADLLAIEADALPPNEVIDDLLDALGVSAPDERTLEVDLVREAPAFVAVVTHYATAPIPESWITQPGATEAGNYVSSGPYVLTEWVHDERQELEPNPMWWGEPSRLTRIEMRTFDLDPDAFDAYQRGELDILEDMGETSDFADQVRPTPGTNVQYLRFDLLKPGSPTASSPDLRRALSLSVNQEALREIIGWGGHAAGSVIPPEMPGHDPSLEPTFDPEAARASLDRALADLGLARADQLRLSMMYPASWFETSSQGAGYLAAQWRDLLGIEVETIPLEGHTYDQYEGHDHDMVWEGWFPDYPHQEAYLRPLYACHGSFNVWGYCNPAVDELLEAAARTADVDEQRAIYLDAQRLVVDDSASLFLGWPGRADTMVAPWVEGLILTPMDLSPGSLFMPQVRIAPH